jgi:hypothetical protein
MAVLEELVGVGFECVTQWVLKGQTIGPATFDWKDHGGWLYAFVVQGEVKYIGLTDRVLRSRLSDYAHNSNFQTTRLRGAILAELQRGRSVLVYGLKISRKEILAAEEGRLRAAYRPPWNRI